MTKQKGFSLIELLIVVAIILIIAAIAIPNFIRAKIAANESAASSSIRTISTAELSYLNSYPTVGYASLAALGSGGTSPCTASPTSACLIDDSLATATSAPGKSGYVYAGSSTITAYFVSTRPTIQSVSGVRSFCATQDGVVRVKDTGGTIASGAACDALPGLK